MSTQTLNGVQSTQKQANRWLITAVSIAGTFITYFSMYAFRKPFTAAQYEGLMVIGVDYKIALIISQVIGYTLSKFVGIKVVSEVQPHERIKYIATLILTSWLSLLLFALTPAPLNIIWMLVNGLCLGMIWGLVFSFVEGKFHTELMAAGLASSFIVSSGVVKSVGLLFLNSDTSEFWMPFFAGAVFIPVLFLGIWLLSKIPGQSEQDIEMRAERVAMTAADRWNCFWMFAPGIAFTVIIYMALNGFRDFRDNFAVELWAGLGFDKEPAILTLSEVPIAVFTLIFIGLMVYVKNNRKAFYLNLIIIGLSGLIMLVLTWMFTQSMISPVLWMILVGLSMYMAYMIYHTMLFERWIALFKCKANVGYLMYVSDAFGYLTSVGIMLYKNFAAPDLSWLEFFLGMCYITGGAVIVLSLFNWFYFREKERQLATIATR